LGIISGPVGGQYKITGFRQNKPFAFATPFELRFRVFSPEPLMYKYIKAGVLVNHEAELAPRAGEWLHPKARPCDGALPKFHQL